MKLELDAVGDGDKPDDDVSYPTQKRSARERAWDLMCDWVGG